VTNTPTVTNRL